MTIFAIKKIKIKNILGAKKKYFKFKLTYLVYLNLT